MDAPAQLELRDASNRWVLRPQDVLLLERVFEREKCPGRELRQQLASHLNVRARQVQVWFQNKRQRTKNVPPALVEDGSAPRPVADDLRAQSAEVLMNLVRGSPPCAADVTEPSSAEHSSSVSPTSSGTPSGGAIITEDLAQTATQLDSATSASDVFAESRAQRRLDGMGGGEAIVVAQMPTQHVPQGVAQPSPANHLASMPPLTQPQPQPQPQPQQQMLPQPQTLPQLQTQPQSPLHLGHFPAPQPHPYGMSLPLRYPTARQTLAAQPLSAFSSPSRSFHPSPLPGFHHTHPAMYGHPEGATNPRIAELPEAYTDGVTVWVRQDLYHWGMRTAGPSADVPPFLESERLLRPMASRPIGAMSRPVGAMPPHGGLPLAEMHLRTPLGTHPDVTDRVPTLHGVHAHGGDVAALSHSHPANRLPSQFIQSYTSRAMPPAFAQPQPNMCHSGGAAMPGDRPMCVAPTYAPSSWVPHPSAQPIEAPRPLISTETTLDGSMVGADCAALDCGNAAPIGEAHAVGIDLRSKPPPRYWSSLSRGEEPATGSLYYSSDSRSCSLSSGLSSSSGSSNSADDDSNNVTDDSGNSGPDADLGSNHHAADGESTGIETSSTSSHNGGSPSQD
mmetsp:Transcript_3516/g.10832  ORF Transcript_3516/g.10832 Transcript_3516/m.10832 type:complete len:619 (-) Transcript_3516:668-2524(-)